MTDADLDAELARRCAAWDEYFAGERERGGSPGEWFTEAVHEVDQERARRGLPKLEV